jgi:hypothetical protein
MGVRALKCKPRPDDYSHGTAGDRGDRQVANATTSGSQTIPYGCAFASWPLLLLMSCPWPLSLPYSPSITRAFVLIRPICS